MHSRPPLTIMLVDDSDLVRFHVRLLLERVPGVSIVHEATDVPEAIEAIERIHPDVLVMDLQMPSGSGVDVLHHLRSRQQPCTTIILSGTLDADRSQACRDAGADHCFNKVADFEKVKEVIIQLRDLGHAAPNCSVPGPPLRE